MPPIEGIYNPAAVVDTVRARSGGGGSGTVEQQTPKISSVSRAKAANGETRLSYETQQAIANGALPPTIAQPKEASQAAESTSGGGEVKDVVSSSSSSASSAPSVPSSASVNVGGGVAASGAGSSGSAPAVGSSVDIEV